MNIHVYLHIRAKRQLLPSPNHRYVIPQSCQIPQEPWAFAIPLHTVLGNRKTYCNLWSNTSFLFNPASHFLTEFRIILGKVAKKLTVQVLVLQLRLPYYVVILKKEALSLSLSLSLLFFPSPLFSPPFSLTSFLTAKWTLLHMVPIPYLLFHFLPLEMFHFLALTSSSQGMLCILVLFLNYLMCLQSIFWTWIECHAGSLGTLRVLFWKPIPLAWPSGGVKSAGSLITWPWSSPLQLFCQWPRTQSR